MANQIPPETSAEFPFEIRRKAGEGAMGIVYEAFDPSLGRPIAVKLMRDELLAELDPANRREARLRFVQEARAAARLTHTGIATIYRIGETSGRPFIAMEWLEGEPLETLLAPGVPLPLGMVARLGVELAEALEAAHSAGVIHRDIKPSNLIIRSDGKLKITDFGIARIEGFDLVKTRAGDIVATPMYASPEQLRGETVDSRTDIFSAGVVLYQCLTGRLPFAGRTMAELTTSILFGSPEPPSSLNRDVPPVLDGIVRRALEKESRHRFSRAGELAEALRGFAAKPAPSTFAKVAPPREVAEAALANRPPGPAPSATLVASEGRTVLQGLPSSAPAMVEAAVETWPSRPVAKGSTRGLLARLAETPLHAEPFAGAVKIGNRFLLLFHDGWLVAALDTTTGEEGDAVVEALPEEAAAELRPIPSTVPPAVIRLLASLLRPRKPRLEGLNSTFVNLPALSRSLRDESFSGILSLRQGSDLARILMHRGIGVLALFSDGWKGIPIGDPWESWVSDVVVSVAVEELAASPVYASFRFQLAEAEVQIQSDESATKSASPGRSLFQTLRRSSSGSPTGANHQLRLMSTGGATLAADDPRARYFELDVARRFLTFLLDETPSVLARLGKEKALKYVSDWIPLVQKARLHHALPRPLSQEKDLFDLVTFDTGGRVLHVAERLSRATPASLKAFVDRVVAAKTARIKTGDIGAAFLVASSFDEGTAEAFRAITSHEEEKARSWTFGAIEAATSYEGFVRIGPRRGFHLVLVEETAAGFEIALP